MVEAHIERDADITIAAQPVTRRRDADGDFPVRRDGQIIGFEEKPTPERLAEIGSSLPAASPDGHAHRGQAVRGVDGHLRLLARCPLRRARARPRGGLRPRNHSARPRHPPGAHVSLSRFLGRRRHGRVVLRRNIMLTSRGAPFSFFHPTRPIYTQPRFLPAARLHGCRIYEALIPRARTSTPARSREASSVSGCRSSAGRRSHDPFCSARTSTKTSRRHPARHRPQHRARPRDRRQERRIGDGARLVNERGIQDVDGDGYYIGALTSCQGRGGETGTVV